MTPSNGYDSGQENIHNLLKFSAVKLHEDIPTLIKSETEHVFGSLEEIGRKKMNLRDFKQNSLILRLEKKSGSLVILKPDYSALGRVGKTGYFSKQKITMKSEDGKIILHSRRNPKNRMEILDENNQSKAFCFFQKVKLPNKFGYYTYTRKFDFEILDESFSHLILLAFFMSIFFYLGRNISVVDRQFD